MKVLVTAIVVLSITFIAVVINSIFVGNTMAETEKMLYSVSESFETDSQKAYAQCQALCDYFDGKRQLLSLSFKETDLQPLRSALTYLTAACKAEDKMEFHAALETALLMCKIYSKAESLYFYTVL